MSWEYRRVKYLTRPTVRAVLQDNKRRQIPNEHESPSLRSMPGQARFPVVFDHPFPSRQCVRALVLWEEKEFA